MIDIAQRCSRHKLEIAELKPDDKSFKKKDRL